ncbi:hypothetical protein [Cloacibacterium sp.]|uniref:hypothetical protein n=1 Tax=Cloacibacterium sp. TaxID=1913682 RepID=UPI0039E55FAB
MKFVFICGSLETGKDGVGDYSRRLAGELIRKGHQASIIAINDRNINVFVKEMQMDEGTAVNTIRIPSDLTWKEKIKHTQEWVNNEKPNWVSLQYVPHSFDLKGLPFAFIYAVSKLKGNFNWHIMFHELWVQEKNLKRFILRKNQQAIILLINKLINIKLKHTHLPIYQKRLKKLNIISYPLPLFSNIECVDDNFIPNDKYFTIGFFSQIEEKIEIINTINKIQNIIKEKIKILLIGGNPSKMSSFKNYILKNFKNIEIETTSFLLNKDISKYIKLCNIAITPVEKHLLGKSGTVAAFLTHNVPIIAPIEQKKYNTINGFFNEKINDMIIDIYKISLNNKNNNNYSILLSSVCEKFINDLNE